MVRFSVITSITTQEYWNWQFFLCPITGQFLLGNQENSITDLGGQDDHFNHYTIILKLPIFTFPDHWTIHITSSGKFDHWSVVWWRLWNFSWNQMKFNTFLYPNKHPWRIFWYLVIQFDCEPSKIGHFQSSKSIFKAKFNQIFLKMIFCLDNHFRWTF